MIKLANYEVVLLDMDTLIIENKEFETDISIMKTIEYLNSKYLVYGITKYNKLEVYKHIKKLYLRMYFQDIISTQMIDLKDVKKLVNCIAKQTLNSDLSKTILVSDKNLFQTALSRSIIDTCLINKNSEQDSSQRVEYEIENFSKIKKYL